jgi:hypothetical protein
MLGEVERAVEDVVRLKGSVSTRRWKGVDRLRCLLCLVILRDKFLRFLFGQRYLRRSHI